MMKKRSQQHKGFEYLVRLFFVRLVLALRVLNFDKDKKLQVVHWVFSSVDGL